ncbi:DUF6703 family protein [Rhizohabitans arisaemae]|uniref:DUF6703 family protein n=1 Tax=Rhizohabitans arisaemae TaxID=2720610 RepID=UPI0024B0618C|nr:DUF6703 family protein [Rhizohabitans arisaemae]
MDNRQSPGLRARLEHKSAPALMFFHRTPRWVTPVVMVALLLAGFVFRDWRGALALLPVLGFVGWLAFLSWPSLGAMGKLLRVALMTFLALLLLSDLGLMS